MKLTTMYFSPTGGTKKVLNLIGTAWDCPRAEIDLSDRSKSLSGLAFQPEDVCIVAVPSFSGRIPQFLVPLLGGLSGNGAKAVLVTAYGNRAFDDTLMELNDVLSGAGFCCVCAVAAVTEHSLMPRFGKGRPDAADVAELKDFAKRCRAAVEAGTGMAEMPGNRPYRDYNAVPLKPKVGKGCNGCGLCAQRCPVGAIPTGKPSGTDAEKCISCMQCVAVCPQKARHVDGLIQRAAELKMKAVCSGRKTNQIYCPAAE